MPKHIFAIIFNTIGFEQYLIYYASKSKFSCKTFKLRHVIYFDINHNFISDDDDDVGLHVLGCRVDILGTNCKFCSCFVVMTLYAPLLI